MRYSFIECVIICILIANTTLFGALIGYLSRINKQIKDVFVQMNSIKNAERLDYLTLHDENKSFARRIESTERIICNIQDIIWPTSSESLKRKPGRPKKILPTENK
jgi:hypothetical protein